MPITIAKRKSLRGLLAVAGFFLLACTAPAQEDGRQTDYAKPQRYTADPGPAPAKAKAEADGAAAKATKPELPTTNKMLILAMESNPDILVAKAKVREAEAELNRTRLQVARQILTLGEFVRNHRALVDTMRAAGAGVTVAALRNKETELSATEAELQYTLGQPLLDGAIAK